MKQIKKIFYIIDFVGYYVLQLVRSNLYIAYDILTPKMQMKPAFIKVHLSLKTDTGILLFSNLLSMTPGSLCIDISADKKILDVHILYFSSDEIMQKDFEKMQNKIKRFTE